MRRRTPFSGFYGLDTILNAGRCMVKVGIMGTARKITVEVPAELLRKAQEASGAGITQTVRTGLELIAASRAYAVVATQGKGSLFTDAG